MQVAVAHIIPLLKSSSPHVLLELSETGMYDRVLSLAAITAALLRICVAQSCSTQDILVWHGHIIIKIVFMVWHQALHMIT